MTRSSGYKCRVSQVLPMAASDNGMRHHGAPDKLRWQAFAPDVMVQPTAVSVGLNSFDWSHNDKILGV